MTPHYDKEEMMKIASQVSFCLKNLDETKFQLQEIGRHSFGFGTSYKDFDDFLRPIAENFLREKIKHLEIEIAMLLKSY